MISSAGRSSSTGSAANRSLTSIMRSKLGLRRGLSGNAIPELLARSSSACRIISSGLFPECTAKRRASSSVSLLRAIIFPTRFLGGFAVTSAARPLPKQSRFASPSRGEAGEALKQDPHPRTATSSTSANLPASAPAGTGRAVPPRRPMHDRTGHTRGCSSGCAPCADSASNYRL